MQNLRNEIAKLISKYSLQDIARNKRYIVSGASGLIGGYLCALLSMAGGKVTAISRSGKILNGICVERNVVGDVRKDAYSTIEEADYIIHAASPASPKVYDTDPLMVIETNVMGTKNALDLAKRTNAKMALISSSEVYGENIWRRPLKEDDPGVVISTNPRSCYSESKRLAENLCVNYDKQFGTQSIIARVAFCYGGNFMNSDDRVVPQFIKMALESGKIVMKSSGIMKRSYIYVADVAIAIIKLLFMNVHGVYNICNEEIVSIRELAENICEITNATLELDEDYSNNAQGISPFSSGILDGGKLRSLGITAEFDIRRGLVAAINAYKELCK